MKRQRTLKKAELDAKKRNSLLDQNEVKFNRVYREAKVDLAMEQRLKMMEEIEADPEKGDGFDSPIKPADLKDDEDEALQDMLQLKAEVKGDLAMQKRK